MRGYTDRYRYLFGPVPSRRLGRSLGIDTIPHKVCTLNCIYCEVGRTTECTADRRHFDNPDNILAEFSRFYPALKEGLDVVTITGAGEPTLNLDMGYLIKGVKKISEHPVAVLTNSTLFTNSGVREELMAADVVVPSLDAATEDVYRKVCAPHRSFNIQDINNSVVDFSREFSGRLLIEVLLCAGINDSDDELKRIADIIKRCRYDLVQLNTVHRPPAFSRAETVSEKALIDTAIYFKSEGINVEPAGNYIKEFAGGELTKEKLERLLTMRPCSLTDISRVFGVAKSTAETTLNNIDKNRLQVNHHKGEDFFFLK